MLTTYLEIKQKKGKRKKEREKRMKEAVWAKEINQK